MFAKVNARYLHLGIRATHEPQNDNDDPWTPAFDPANFKYCVHLVAIVKAARERRPDVELVATLGTPPPWMKTNNAESGGGKEKATLKPKLELEFAEYLWAFLAHMTRNGALGLTTLAGSVLHPQMQDLINKVDELINALRR